MKTTISLILIFVLLCGALAYFLLANESKKDSDTSNINSEPSITEETDNNSRIKIIAVGDSLTAGFDLPLVDSYPKILEKKLSESGEKVEVVNAGISGETTAGLLERAEFIVEQKPDLLLITTGGNDAFRNLPIKSTKENIKAALQIFKRNVKADNIYLLQIETTANLGISYREEFNDMYKDIASSEEVNLLPFVVREVFLDPNKMLSDGIHPNQAGYEYIVNEFIFPEISKKIIR